MKTIEFLINKEPALLIELKNDGSISNVKCTGELFAEVVKDEPTKLHIFSTFVEAREREITVDVKGEHNFKLVYGENYKTLEEVKIEDGVVTDEASFAKYLTVLDEPTRLNNILAHERWVLTVIPGEVKKPEPPKTPPTK